MSVRDLIILPDPVLRQVSKPVAAVDEGVRRLWDEMLETMYAAPGIGLTAGAVSLRGSTTVKVSPKTGAYEATGSMVAETEPFDFNANPNRGFALDQAVKIAGAVGEAITLGAAEEFDQTYTGTLDFSMSGVW